MGAGPSSTDFCVPVLSLRCPCCVPVLSPLLQLRTRTFSVVLEKTAQVIFVLQNYFSPIHGETEAGLAQLFSLLFLQPLVAPARPPRVWGASGGAHCTHRRSGGGRSCCFLLEETRRPFLACSLCIQEPPGELLVSPAALQG